MRIIISTTCCLMTNTLMLFNFTKCADLQNWYVVVIIVMCGESTGIAGVDAEGNAVYFITNAAIKNR